ncbi:MAG: electron transport complex subunit E [Candidatus Margulisiibacteriota bacterium]
MLDRLRHYWKTFDNGILRENPILRLMIGLCPTLAVSTSLINSVGMGLATTFVLVFSNLFVSLLRKFTPNGIRIPIFIVVVSTFVTLTDYMMLAYVPELHKSLGVFVPLIVVNCIILGRAEAFAYKNDAVLSTIDGLGMGLGFTLAISTIGIIREILGNGTILGYSLFGASFNPAIIMILPPGAFITIGFLMAALNALTRKGEGGK